jgi:hypothetical protein
MSDGVIYVPLIDVDHQLLAQLVALVDDHVRVDTPLYATERGEAERVIVGDGI